jgi:hypothetical protein
MKNFNNKSLSFNQKVKQLGQKMILPVLTSIALSGAIMSTKLSAQEPQAGSESTKKVEKSFIESTKDLGRKYAIYVNLMSFAVLGTYMLLDYFRRGELKNHMTSLGQSDEINKMFKGFQSKVNEIALEENSVDVDALMDEMLKTITAEEKKYGKEFKLLTDFVKITKKLKQKLEQKKTFNKLAFYEMNEAKEALEVLRKKIDRSQRSLNKVPYAGLATTALAAVTVFLSGEGQKDFALGIALSKAAIGFFYSLFKDLDREISEETSLKMTVDNVDVFFRTKIIPLVMSGAKNGKNN